MLGRCKRGAKIVIGVSDDFPAGGTSMLADALEGDEENEDPSD